MRLGIGDGLTTTTTHWSPRAGWEPGREKYALHLTFEDAPALHAARAAVIPALDLSVAQPVAESGLHLTLVGLGFTDELDEGTARACASAALTGWRAPTLTFDQVLVAGESLMLTAAPTPWLDELVQAQRAAVDAALGPREWGTFWPHTSLAYFHASALVLDVARAVERLPFPDTLVVTPRLTLLRLRRETRAYTWDVVAQA